MNYAIDDTEVLFLPKHLESEVFPAVCDGCLGSPYQNCNIRGIDPTLDKQGDMKLSLFQSSSGQNHEPILKLRVIPDHEPFNPTLTQA